jgi:guanine deaminase
LHLTFFRYSLLLLFCRCLMKIPSKLKQVFHFFRTFTVFSFWKKKFLEDYKRAMSMMNDEQFMRKAIELSVKNIDENGGPFGAVIVKDGKIIAQGVNRVTSSIDPTAHAEVTAIREASKKLGTFDLSGCVIYSSCEPCPMCLGAIYWARLDKLYYGNTKKDAKDIGFDDSFIYDEIELPKEKRKIPTIQILNKEALVAFEKWRKKEDKIEY